MADVSLRGHEVGELRDLALGGLRGRVLEIGFGSGLNVRWYPPEVTAVGAVEPSDVGWRLSERRRARSAIPIERTGLDGERIDEPDASYDGAVSTFTLCTIPDAAAALREVRRVLRPGATFHVLEHGLAPEPDVARRQRRLGARSEAARRRVPPHPRPRRPPRGGRVHDRRARGGVPARAAVSGRGPTSTGSREGVRTQRLLCQAWARFTATIGEQRDEQTARTRPGAANGIEIGMNATSETIANAS